MWLEYRLFGWNGKKLKEVCRIQTTKGQRGMVDDLKLLWASQMSKQDRDRIQFVNQNPSSDVNRMNRLQSREATSQKQIQNNPCEKEYGLNQCSGSEDGFQG